MMKHLKKICLAAIATIVNSVTMFAQGVAGLEAANSEIKEYIGPAGDLALVIGAVVGIIGAIRVYVKWNSGDQDVQKTVMSWGGACIFLVVSSIVIEAFFGV